MNIWTILILWILTIIFSFCFQTYLVINIVKTLAYNSYTFDNKRLNKIEKFSSTNYKSLMFVPCINIIYSIYLLSVYNKCAENLFNQMYYLDILIEFTSEDKEEYRKNPDIWTAFNIMIKRNEEVE